MYNGLKLALVGSTISMGTYFFWYRFWKLVMLQHNPVLGNPQIILITALAGITCSTITSPIWLIQARMSLNKEKTLLDHIKEIYKKEGFRAFFKGLGPDTILVLNPIINFLIYEKLKGSYLVENISPSAYKIFLFSVLAKFIATIITYPILTAKTICSVDKENRPSIEILKDTYAKKGFWNFYRGIEPKLLQTLLYNALMMMIYEKLRFTT